MKTGPLAAAAAANCTLLAATLSESYRSDLTFAGRGSDDLKEYLSGNGVLLTLCAGLPFLPACREYHQKNSPAKKVSASWIQKDTTGFGVYLSGDFGVGLVLDPTAAEIRCVYPANAVSDRRDDGGCGPMKTDPEYGSRGASRWSTAELWTRRAAMLAYKTKRFGFGTDWLDISCDDLFLQPPDFDMVVYGRAKREGTCEEMTEGRAPAAVERIAAGKQREWTRIMGHPVCNLTDPYPHVANTTLLYYNGECSWRPSDWSHMMGTMGGWMSRYPEALIWNEVVLAVPSAIEDIVRAVFYLPAGEGGFADERAYRRAEAEANRMGKPLLRVDRDGESLFSCAEKDGPRTGWLRPRYFFPGGRLSEHDYFEWIRI